MMPDYYNLEKMYEFEQKEKERMARDFWKWAPHRVPRKLFKLFAASVPLTAKHVQSDAVKKEVIDK